MSARARARAGALPGSASLGRAAAGAAFMVLLAGCDDIGGKGPLPAPPTTSRNNAVMAASNAAPLTSAKPVSTAATPVTAAPPRTLCAGQTARPAPKGALESAAAPGAQAPAKIIPFGVGKWVWVNFWAAWCKPCKEEMPRLLEWQKKLSAAGVLLELAFVSIDDDQRQLQRFLEEQPSTGSGVRASYWLPEGGGRTSWLASLGLKESPELPAHAFVAPSGQVSCVFQGAVEERDYPTLAAFFGASSSAKP